MKKQFLLWSICYVVTLYGGLTDEAYRAYKKGEESRAFELYNMAL